MPNDKFYRTIFKLEVLSDRPINDLDIEEIAAEITTGDCSGSFSCDTIEELTPTQVAEALQAQGSDPEFLLGDTYQECENCHEWVEGDESSVCPKCNQPFPQPEEVEDDG